MNGQVQFKQTTFSDSGVEATATYALQRELEKDSTIGRNAIRF